MNKVSVIGNGLARLSGAIGAALSSPRETLKIAKGHLAEARAKEDGKAISKAVRVKTLEEVAPKLKVKGPASPTDVVVRMKDGRPMRYWSDGSLRHAMVLKPTAKTLKKARRKAAQHDHA